MLTPVFGRAGPRGLPGAARSPPRWRQGAPGGGAEPSANLVQRVSPAARRVSVSSRCGGASPARLLDRGVPSTEALAALQSLQHELEDRNQSAAQSGRPEGLDETLTLHRLGVYGLLGRSLKTTNGLDINALIEERCAKVDHWQNSSQRQRWLATALLDIEPRIRKVMGYRHLPKLRDALKRELKIDTTTSKKKAA